MSEQLISRFYSHGKLLLTGEYLVLDGARALAIPTRMGQSLTVEIEKTGENLLNWTSIIHDQKVWFEGLFALPAGRFLFGTDQQVGKRLEQLLQTGKALQPGLWEKEPGYTYTIHTNLEFPPNWGLGSSSTLIANLAQWWQVDPYRLLAGTFGGSGYDLACAGASGPVYYQFRPEGPIVESADFYPPFSDQLYFLFLEKKQDSRAGIAHYRNRGNPNPDTLNQISQLSRKATELSELKDFQALLQLHDAIIGRVLEIAPVKKRLFPDFPGALKSLGAWGGDFVLAASDRPFPELTTYFAERGYPVLIPYAEMVFGNQ